VGGVPGQDIRLEPDGTAETAWGSLGCPSNGVFDNLAVDGGVAGVLHPPSSAGSAGQAAYWDANGVRTLVPLEAGEQSSAGVAVATRGRMVIRAETAAGPTLSLWRNGTRTPLTLPAGWTPGQVTEFTDTGLVLGMASDPAGTSRPVVWNVAGR